jgi:glutamate---cysteine ligase / carboxylate-amine ligase
MRTCGVEEELLLVDADTGVPVALADLVARPESGDGEPAGDGGDGEAAPASLSVAVGVRDAPGDSGSVIDDRPVHELRREQIETDTRPCSSLDDLVVQLTGRRAAAGQAAHRIGAEVAALATSPLPIRPSVTLDERYVRMAELYAMTAQEQHTLSVE